MRNGIISLSGGADSATTLALALKEGFEMRAVAFRYGSKHNELELAAATKIADYYKVPFNIIDIRETMKNFKSSLLQADVEVPKGRYDDKNMASTVVPCRNLIFATILAGIADSHGISTVWLGVHGGDHYIYPDCRPETIQALESMLSFATENRIKAVHCPFENIDKAGIIKLGLEMKVPYELTRTCYESHELACGKCGSCNERLAAFHANQVVDPIRYEEMEEK